MGLVSKALKLGAVVALLVSVVIGLFMAGVPKRLGFFAWWTRTNPQITHLLPVFVEDDYQWGYHFTQLPDLTGKKALVTGANSGTGYWTALILTRAGASVTLSCRSALKCEAAVGKIRANTTNGHLDTLIMDTSKLSSVRRAADEYRNRTATLDMLFLNAGISGASKTEGRIPLSEDGIELVFATNYVGHHLLYKILAPLLEAAGVARIVLTSSASHWDSYEYGVATDLSTLNNATPSIKNEHYGQSKLAQVLWALELTRQLGPDSGIYVNSYHPGMAYTSIWENTAKYNPAAAFLEKYASQYMWSAEEGALTGVYLGVEPGNPNHPHRGQYFHPIALPIVPSETARNVELQKAVWDFADRLVENH